MYCTYSLSSVPTKCADTYACVLFVISLFLQLRKNLCRSRIFSVPLSFPAKYATCIASMRLVNTTNTIQEYDLTLQHRLLYTSL